MKIEKFEDLNLDKDILKALNNLGFMEPSEVQKVAIPKMLENKDLVIKSQTGSGKTASFGIPMCQLINSEENKIKGLVLVPTRELAMQVKEDISNIGRLKKIRVAAIFGKQPFKDQVSELKQRIHIVSGTPGRVIDHIERGNIEVDSIEYVVIDEADKMLNMGFVDQIKDVLKKLPNVKNTHLFSATIPEEIEKLYMGQMKNPEIIEVKSKVFNRDKITEKYVEVDYDFKIKALEKLIYAKTDESVIIFANTKDVVKNVSKALGRSGIRVRELQGDMEQKDRLKTMEDFKNKEFKVLVATDIAARGIHISHITNVINFDIPMEKESYVHRIGRSGRGEKSGLAISLLTERDRRYFNEIQEYIGYEIERMDLPSEEEVEKGKEDFLAHQNKNYGKKVKTKKVIHGEVTKIHLSAGKKKKIRNIDILGALSNLDELTGADIGIIDVQDGFSYVDILNGKGKLILKKYKEVKLKGKLVKVSNAKN